MSPSLITLLSVLRPPYRLRSVYERLLGTEVEIQVVARTRRQAEAAERAALDELERLSAVFNRFDPGSELSRWLARPGQQTPLSPELQTVLVLTDGWREVTAGAFHPGADALGKLWQTADTRGQEPAAESLAALVRHLQSAPWMLHDDGSATLHAAYPLGLNALAKGWIVDRMVELAWSLPGIRAVMINAGGDLRTTGGRGLEVMVADPFTARDDDPPLVQVHLQNGALASSGSAYRGVQVGDRWHSHLIDPRSGLPVQNVSGVTVTAPDCATADALATALSVLGLQAGLTLTDGTPGCAALIITPDGQRHPSTLWPPDVPVR
ncbi:FAD:protein FMN transferase [Deinococcus radiopugnans]|uniref:FAD:protein FMN transferase n=1 Tax=Deinococcus radiopugnans ATCC 19172 TaxID=585398 RepID=A0ABR6NSV3_9DEIO|nr:FAD:protein FMN transferase [Deinococcus radiopugnans]MBB6017101.1 thiamine biosynthesis lipoprotein [Deinococcus radiopugnans ATCC 19172]